MYSSIVVGTDGSSTARRAVDEAARLAQVLGCVLHIVSAYEPLRGAHVKGAPEGAAKALALAPDDKVQAVVDEAAAAARFNGVTTRSHTVTGDAADALMEVAEREGADLIVVGNRGMHGVRRVLGSVPNKVSHQATRCVLIVPTDQN